MKKCSFCGNIVPDGLSACSIDGKPLIYLYGKNHPTPKTGDNKTESDREEATSSEPPSPTAKYRSKVRFVLVLVAVLLICIGMSAINRWQEKRNRFSAMEALHDKMIQDLKMGLKGCYLDPITRDFSFGDFQRMKNYWGRAVEESVRLDAYDEKQRDSLKPNVRVLSLAIATIPGTLESRKQVGGFMWRHGVLNHEEARILFDFEHGANTVAAVAHGSSLFDETNWELAPYPDVVERFGRDEDKKRGYSDGQTMGTFGDFELDTHTSSSANDQLRQYAARCARENHLKATIDYIDSFCEGYADAH